MYEKLRARINELLPDRLELKFGCEVVVDFAGEYENGTVLFDCGKCTKHKRSSNCTEDCVDENRIEPAVCVQIGSDEEGFFNDAFLEDKIIEILGTPIYLHDVLRCIGLIERPLPVAMTNTWWNKQERKLLDGWNLTLPLSGQSEETLTFLAELLDVK